MISILKMFISIMTATILTVTVSADDSSECIFCEMGLECLSSFRLICSCSDEECFEECGICPRLLLDGYPCRQGLYIKCICEQDEECFALVVRTPVSPISSEESSSSEIPVENNNPVIGSEIIYDENTDIQSDIGSSSEPIELPLEVISSSESEALSDINIPLDSSSEEQSSSQLTIGSSDGQPSIGFSDTETMTTEQVEKALQDLKEVRQLLQGLLWFGTFIFSVVICWIVVRQLYKFFN